MNMLTLTARLRALGIDTSDTPAPQTEVSGVTLPPLVCTPDTFDTRKKSSGSPFGVDSPAAPTADAAPVSYHFSAPVPGKVDPDAFDVRVALFMFHHVQSREAGNLADRLSRRDAQNDDRRLCLECCHLSGTADARRCSNWRAKGMRGPAIPGELVDLLQRCAGFVEQVGQVPMIALAANLAPCEESPDLDVYL